MLFGKFSFIIFFILYSSFASKYEDAYDNEFAEFEDFDVEEEVIPNEVPDENEFKETQDTSQADDDEADIVIDDEDDDSEFEHFQDVEEFEGFDSKDDKPATEPKITITKVPIHFRANWDSYWLEILMISGLVVYFINFVTGKSKNTKIANVWLQTHRQLLEDNFSLVGDDGALEKGENLGFVKESENVFNLWCSGRTCCEGMLVELKLIKRQDLLAILSGMMRPTLDQVHIKVTMNKEDMDSFVFCIASKKTAQHLSKEMNDLSVYCPERRAGEKHNIPTNFSVMSEIAEATSAMLDSKVVAVLNKYTDLVDYIHFSDQYSGPKQQDDNGTLKLPEYQKVLMFGFNVPFKGMSLEEAINQIKPLLIMVFYCMEKVKKYRLSKEGKVFIKL